MMSLCPLTKSELDQFFGPACKCGIPHDNGIEAKCHPGEPTDVTYANGVLTIRCCICADLVCEIQVAEKVKES